VRAVWSFWTKPFRTQTGWHWSHERMHWLSWVLSVHTASKHYRETALVTDSPGKKMLVDTLGLQFGEVSTELDALEGADARWWALGKLHAYAAQQKPFVHIDADVFLWKRLPGMLENAPVLAQSPEHVSDRGSYPTGLVAHQLEAEGGWVPPAWKSYMTRTNQEAACCGILGGNDVEFLNRYARDAIDVATRPENERGWARLGDRAHYNPLVEQYTLTACAHHYRASGAARRDLYVQYLFPTWATGDADGYTHLISNSKRHPDNIARLEAVVRRDYPIHYERCDQGAAAQSIQKDGLEQARSDLDHCASTTAE
jgi:hypothetical protein